MEAQSVASMATFVLLADMLTFRRSRYAVNHATLNTRLGQEEARKANLMRQGLPDLVVEKAWLVQTPH